MDKTLFTGGQKVKIVLITWKKADALPKEKLN